MPAIYSPPTASIELREGFLGGLQATRLLIHCAHGASDWYVLRGTDERQNRQALELTRDRHRIRTGCDCRLELPSV